MRKRARQFWFAFGFLTVLPGLGRIRVDNAETGGGSVFFPVVGLFLGLFPLGFGLWTGPSPLLRSVLICVSLIFMTRGIHADGVIDTFDGFLSNKREKTEILSVMRDSTAGALGVVSAFCLYLLKTALVYEALTTMEPRLITALMIPPVLARGPVAFCCALCGPADRSGMGGGFVRSVRVRHAATALLLSVLFCFRPSMWYASLLPVAAALLWWGWGLLCRRKIGGMTGDTIGAGIEIVETLGFALILVLP